MHTFTDTSTGKQDLPGMAGRRGFEQARPGEVSKNDAQIIDAGPLAPGSPAAVKPGSPDVPSAPGSGEIPASSPPSPPPSNDPNQNDAVPPLAPGQDAGAAGAANPAPAGQEANNNTATTLPEQKLAPGLGSDQTSVAPALENDPQGNNMPKTLPGAASVTAGTEAAPQGAFVPGQPVASDPNAVVDPNASSTQQRPLDPSAPQDPTAPPVDPNAATGALGLTGVAAAGAAAAPGTGPALTTNNGTNTTNTNANANANGNDVEIGQTQSPITSSCTSPLIRKEYSSLSRAEKMAFVSAIKCVRSKPSRFRTSTPGWSAADDWTLLHIRMVKYVHFTAYFAPFHRGYMAIVERDLNECGFPLGLPWVDWTKTPADPSTNHLWDADPEFGLGTDGKGDNKECPWGTGRAVIDGALANHTFNAPFKHRLCRQFNNLDVNAPNPHFGSNCTTFITPDFVKGLGRTHDDGKFFDFSSALEISTHLSMHTCVGGNLAWLSSSPNDMVFYTHHGCVDNIFASWQRKSDKNKQAFHGPKEQQKGGKHPPWTAQRTDVINFEPMAENVVVQDLLDPESGKWGGRMCYRYDYNVAM